MKNFIKLIFLEGINLYLLILEGLAAIYKLVLVILAIFSVEDIDLTNITYFLKLGGPLPLFILFLSFVLQLLFTAYKQFITNQQDTMLYLECIKKNIDFKGWQDRADPNKISLVFDIKLQMRNPTPIATWIDIAFQDINDPGWALMSDLSEIQITQKGKLIGRPTNNRIDVTTGTSISNFEFTLYFKGPSNHADPLFFSSLRDIDLILTYTQFNKRPKELEILFPVDRIHTQLIQHCIVKEHNINNPQARLPTTIDTILTRHKNYLRNLWEVDK